MAVLTYKGGKYRNLAGNKIYDGSKWVTMAGDSKIFLDGAWRNFSWKKAELPVIPDEPEIPDWDDFTHLATEEPTGNVLYMTPTGDGAMNGTSWDNAFSASQIHVAALSLGEGDRLYMAEGDYGTLSVPLQTSVAFGIYGGFIEGDYSWETRDAVNHPTTWTGDGTIPFAVTSAGIVLDGLVLTNFASTTIKVTGRNLTVTDCSFDAVDSSDEVINTFTNCRFSGNASAKVTASSASSCYFRGDENSSFPIAIETLTDSIVVRCNNAVYDDEFLLLAILCSSATNTKFYNIHIDNKIIDGSECMGVCTIAATNCLFAGCNASVLVLRNMDGCTIKDSEGRISFGGDIPQSRSYISGLKTPVGGSNIYLATIVNSEINASIRDCTVVNCTGNLTTCEDCIFVNTSFDSFSGGGGLSLFVNCSISGTISSANYTTIVNSIAEVQSGVSTVFWNNNGTIPAANNAQSAYDADNTLTLGTDNSIARFVNTGYAPAIGVQDIGDCPDPIEDPEGFADYLASFGDWHPQSDSFLIGKGVYNSSYPTDLDGVTRPNPPTIGAYEPKPAEASE